MRLNRREYVDIPELFFLATVRLNCGRKDSTVRTSRILKQQF